MLNDILDTLNDARKAQGLSGRELAEKSGVSMQNLYRVLRGEQSMSVDTLLRLCEALGITLNLSSSETHAV